jgi:hypothetical protein
MNNKTKQTRIARHDELLFQSDLREESTKLDSRQFENDELMELAPNIDGCYCSQYDLDHVDMSLDIKDQDNDYICPKCKDECVVRFALKLLGLTFDRDEDNK